MQERESLLEAMGRDLRGWGVGLLIMGAIHMLIPFLWAPWGVVLMGLGVAALVIHHRAMYIALGLSLVVVGCLNILGGLDSEAPIWSAFGAMQIYWGVKEMGKYGKIGRLLAQQK